MNDKLDNVLKEWAENKKASDQHLHELTGQIRVEAARVNYNAVEDDVGYEVPFVSKVFYSVIGAAVALVIMALVQSVEQGNGAVALASIPCEKFKVSKQLFSEMQKMFPDNLRWVAESNGDINMGVESISGDVDESAAPMLVRVTVVSREKGTKIWKPAWKTDIILRGEEIAEVPSSRGDDGKIALWVYSLNDGKIAVDTNMALDVPFRLALHENVVVDPGEPVELLSMTEADVEYKVFQTVRPLEDDNA